MQSLMNGVLLPGIWYGEVSQISLEDLKKDLLSVHDECDCILLITEVMKKGDFSVKNLLIDLMNQTEDEAVLNLCIRLFCSVYTHFNQWLGLLGCRSENPGTDRYDFED